MKGKWRIVEMPDYTADYPDMMEPAYILFDGNGGGDFAFGCVTGAINGAGTTDNVAFSWNGADEHDQARATAGRNDSPTGRSMGRSASGGDEADFSARPW